MIEGSLREIHATTHSGTLLYFPLNLEESLINSVMSLTFGRTFSMLSGRSAAVLFLSQNSLAERMSAMFLRGKEKVVTEEVVKEANIAGENEARLRTWSPGR